MSQATKRTAICTKLEKKLVKPIMPEMAVRIGLPGVDADLGEVARLEQLRLGEVPPPASRPKPANELKTTWARELKFPMMKANSPIYNVLRMRRAITSSSGRHSPEEARQGDVDGDEDARQPVNIALNQPEAGIDILGERPQEIVDDAGAVHGDCLFSKRDARFSGTSARSRVDSPRHN